MFSHLFSVYFDFALAGSNPKFLKEIFALSQPSKTNIPVDILVRSIRTLNFEVIEWVSSITNLDQLHHSSFLTKLIVELGKSFDQEKF